jgi:hypothetical protein
MKGGAVGHNFEMGLPKDYPCQAWGFGMVTCTMSSLSRFTADLLPVYRATYK